MRSREHLGSLKQIFFFNMYEREEGEAGPASGCEEGQRTGTHCVRGRTRE